MHPQPQSKYISMFRINGDPILPPLMTAEKRRNMRKLREKAIRMERKLETNSLQKSSLQCGIDFPKASLAEQEYDSRHESSTGSGGILSESDEIIAKQKQNICYLANMMGTNYIARDGDDNEHIRDKYTKKIYVDASTNTSCTDASLEKTLAERLQKLQVSETLIYDNSPQSSIISMADEEIDRLQRNRTQDMYDNIDCSDDSWLSLDTPDNFSFERISKQIPSICVDPPTPLVNSRNFCDSLSPTESINIEINDIRTESSHNLDKVPFLEDFSSDDSSKYSQSHISRKYNHNAIESFNNIADQIKQFEGIRDKKALSIKPQRSSTSLSLKSIGKTTTENNLNVSNTSQSGNPLIRSNSFTLETPSNALLEHMKQQFKDKSSNNRAAPLDISRTNGRIDSGLRRISPSARIVRDTVESKAKRVQKIETKPRVLPRQPTKSCGNNLNNYISPYQSTNNSNVNKSKNKRPQSVLNSANKSNKVTCPVKKSSIAGMTAPTKQLKSQTSMPIVNAISPISVLKETDDMLTEVNGQNHKRFLKLLQKQEEEQRRMEITFQSQQKVLLEQLTNEMELSYTMSTQSAKTDSTVRASAQNSPALKSKCDFRNGSSKSHNASSISTNSTIKSMYTDAFDDASTCSNISKRGASSLQGNMSYRSTTTPRRRLFGQEHTSAIRSSHSSEGAVGIVRNYGAPSPRVAIPVSASSASRRQQHECENVRRMHAATIINAYARGFLVRRLFQTEQIQRIVQTIRDTLIFVLNLHLETLETPEEANTPANIKLKARLLQQLSSASRTLHLVFFQTTIKERMEIISRDRKRMRTKLLTMSMKRSPIITH